MEEEKIPELFMVLVEKFKEFTPLKGKGLVEKKIGEYIVKTTADGKTKDNENWEIEPFTFYIFRNGWLVGIVNPRGGELLINEDELIASLKNEI